MKKHSGQQIVTKLRDADVAIGQGLTGAILDRLAHRVHILETNGESYRHRRPQAAAEDGEAFTKKNRCPVRSGAPRIRALRYWSATSHGVTRPASQRLPYFLPLFFLGFLTSLRLALLPFPI
jgi:hypothetical protein